jgi:hypothetical protein
MLKVTRLDKKYPTFNELTSTSMHLHKLLLMLTETTEQCANPHVVFPLETLVQNVLTIYDFYIWILDSYCLKLIIPITLEEESKFWNNSLCKSLETSVVKLWYFYRLFYFVWKVHERERWEVHIERATQKSWGRWNISQNKPDTRL